jgi:hypothetical protein
VKTGHFRYAVYQAVMRCSIRSPQDMTRKRVVVMDRGTAEWLANLFPGAAVEPLDGMGVVPRKGKPGRHRQHGSKAQKNRAYNERKKREWLAQLDLINGTSLVVGRYPWFDQEIRSQLQEFTQTSDENTVFYRRRRSNGSLSSSPDDDPLLEGASWLIGQCHLCGGPCLCGDGKSDLSVSIGML